MVSPPRRRKWLPRTVLVVVLVLVMLRHGYYWNHQIITNVLLTKSGQATPPQHGLCLLDNNNDCHGTISFPPTVSTCNLSSLGFDETKMHKTATPLVFVPIPNNNATTRVGYGPFLTKCGSSSTIAMLKYLANDTSPWGSPNEYSNNVELILEKKQQQLKFISFTRHPLERALAGYAQMEVFYRMGWIDGLIQEFNLTWWNESCVNYGTNKPVKSKLYPCTPFNNNNNTMETKLQRLHAFLHDVETRGFVDQHVTPQSYLLATSPLILQQDQFFLFDLQDMNRVHYAISKMYNKTFYIRRYKDRKSQQTNKNKMIQWQNLTSWAKQNVTLAKDIIHKLCLLYRHDIECLQHEVPECDAILPVHGNQS